MIDTQAIRNKILDLAIRGKLTEQLPEDGTAEELYEQIQAEKKALIKEKKIRKSKPLPEITEDEIPFDIPDTWKWVRLIDVCDIIMGQSPDGSSISGNPSDGVEFHQGKKSFGDTYLLESGVYTSSPKKIAEDNSVLLCVRAPVGVVNITRRRICIGRGLCSIKGINGIDTDYLSYAIMQKQKPFELLSKGSTFDAITNDVVKTQLIPLPPLPEQERIDNRIKDLFLNLDLIDELQNEYSKNLDVLRSKIVDAGIRGELTEQLPEDGTAEELYEQIQAEKEALIKEKKIRKSKPLPEITEDEIPFDIPDNWKWVRIGEVFTLQSGKNITASSISATSDSEHLYPCFGGNGQRGYVKDFNVSGKHALIGRQGALCGNINVADGDFYATEHAVVVYQYADTNVSWVSIALEALNLNQYATSVAQPGLAVGKIEKALMPLPPPAEQERIAEKIEELLAAMPK